MRKKVTVLLSTSLAWPAWAGCSRAELFSQPGTIFFAQPCTVHAPRQRFISSRQMLMVLMEDLSARARPAGHPIDTFHVFVFVPIIFYLYLESGLPVAQGGFWLVVVFTSWWTKGLRANS